MICQGDYYKIETKVQASKADKMGSNEGSGKSKHHRLTKAANDIGLLEVRGGNRRHTTSPWDKYRMFLL